MFHCCHDREICPAHAANEISKFDPTCQGRDMQVRGRNLGSKFFGGIVEHAKLFYIICFLAARSTSAASDESEHQNIEYYTGPIHFPN